MPKQRIELYVTEPGAGTPDADASTLAAKFAMLRSWGVDQVVVERAESGQAAAAAGLDVVFSQFWNTQMSMEVITDLVEYAATIPNLREIIMMDEPEMYLAKQFKEALAGNPSTWDYTPAHFAAARQKALEVWPGPGEAPALSIAFYGPRERWNHLEQAYYRQCLPLCDVLRVSVFPYLDAHHYRKSLIWMRNAETWLQREGLSAAICTTLQAWSSVNPPTIMLPPIPELRVMAFQVLLGGASTVSFFKYTPDEWANVPGYTDAFKAMIAELAEAAAELDEASVSCQMGFDNVLRAYARRTDGDWNYLVNTNMEPVYSDLLAGLEVRKTAAVTLAAYPWETPAVEESPTEPLVAANAVSNGQ